MKKDRILLALEAFILSLLLSLSISTTALAVPQTLVDSVPSPGSLSITVNDDGSMSIQQYDGVVFNNLTQQRSGMSGTIDRKGSLLNSNGLSMPCGLGGFDQNVLPGSPVSNVLDSQANTITTTLTCVNNNLTFTQVVTYLPGSDFISYKWSIRNFAAAAAATNLSFIHGHDGVFDPSGYFSSFENAVGYYNPLSTVVGAYQLNFMMTSIQRMAIRSPMTPAFYDVIDGDSIFSSTPFSSPLQLTNTLSSNTPVGYAAQWQLSSLAPLSTWVIEAFERFDEAPYVGGIYLDSPIGDLVTEGTPKDIAFRISVNDSNQIIDSIATMMPPGWTAQVLSPNPNSPFPVTLGTPVDVLVRITSPLGVAIGDVAPLLISYAISGRGSIADQAYLTVNNLLPTPTPTSTPTNTPTSTPTFTSTPTATSTPTPQASNTPIPDPIVPVLTAPLRGSASQAPVFSGRAFPGATVQIIVDGNVVVSTVALKSGKWEVSSPVSLPAGPHTISVSAVDPLGRTTTLASPATFVITGGAVLDFDGDGFTDVTRYSSSGTSIAFRSRKSSDDTTLNISLPGTVPAAGDYDGDLVWDAATIAVSGEDLVWRVRLASTSTITTVAFGKKGEQPLTGCSFNTARTTALAVIRGKKQVVSRDITGTESTSPVLTTGKIVGCADLNGDGIDEAIAVEDGPGDQINARAVSLSGATVDSVTLPKFDRGFPIRRLVSENPIFAIVSLTGPNTRLARIVGLDDDSVDTFQINLPRKVVVSSGVFLNPDGSVVPKLVYQDIKKGTITARKLEKVSPTEDLGRIANRTSLLLPMYLYNTRRE